jgi:hypothetical protein
MNGSHLSNRSSTLIWLAAALVAVQTSAAANPTAHAAEAAHSAGWEFSPYRIVVYVEFDAAPDWASDARGTFVSELESRTRSFIGGVWNLKAVEAPADLRWNSTADIARVAGDSVLAAALDADKLMLVGVGQSIDGRRECRVREFDLRSESWGPVFASSQPSRVGLADGLVAALWAAFRPLVRIEAMPGPGVVVARVRGGELPIATPAHSLVREGLAIRPLVRHFDAKGRTLKNGVFPIDWTLLIVDSAGGAIARCHVATGIADPLDLKFDGRTEYLGLAAIAPRETSTELTVRARGTQRPLEDIEILAQRPGEKSPRLVGRTDSQGTIKLESNGDFATIFIRGGDDLLARFPLVAGLDPSVTAQVDDNGRRLESGQLVASISDELIDLVAQQTALKTRFRRQVVRGDSQEAAKTLAAMKSLRTSEAFLKSIEDRRASLSDVVSGPAGVAWLDKQIDAIKPLATKYLLDAKAVAQLEAALNDR